MGRARIAVIVIGLALLVFVARFSSRQYEIIDWDEDTFMLMAQEVQRGVLPYIRLFDNKPPGMFFVLAGVLAAFGQSVSVVRWFGDACVLATALLVFGTARRYVSDTLGALLAGVWVATTVGGLGLHTSTELLADIPLVAALWLILAQGEKGWSPWIVGLLLSLATLTRTNLVYVCIGIGILYALAAFGLKGLRLYRAGLMGYLVGGLLPVGILVAAYAAEGALSSLYLATVIVPASYAYAQGGVASVLAQFANGLAGIFADHLVWTALFLVLLALALGVILFALARRWTTLPARRDLVVIVVMAATVLLSIAGSGTFFSHYLLQLFPLAAVLIAYAEGTGWPPMKYATGVLSAVSLGTLLLWAVPATLPVALGGPTIEANYPVRKAAAAIAADRQPSDRTWALANHLVLFYLDEAPISPIFTQPSNIAVPSIANPLLAAGYIAPDEIGRIMALMPRYIVTEGPDVPGYLLPADRKRISAMLAASYSLWYKGDEVAVFRRN